MAAGKYLECGKIVNTHGFRGEVKIEPWCDSPRVLTELGRIYWKRGTSFRESRILHASVFKQFVIAALEGVSGEAAAEALKGTVIYAAREDFSLPEGSYFLADLEGLPVIDAETGKQYGTVKEVVNRGASDLYVVKTPGGEAMFPAVPEFLKKVDIEKGVFVSPIPGMFDEDGETV